jgi:hypothetical protein
MRILLLLIIIAAYQKLRIKMHTTFFNRNRKGFQWLTSETIILFFGAILLIATIAFFFRLQSTVFAEEDDGSKANFIRLQDEIKEMMTNNIAEKTINYFISEDFVVAGFDTNWDDSKGKSRNSENVIFAKWIFLHNSLYRPYKCGNSACLCLYKKIDRLPDKLEDSDKNVLDCRREGFTDKDIIFLSGGGEFIETQTCNTMGVNSCVPGSYVSSNKFGVNELHIKIDEIAGVQHVSITN